MKDSWERFQRGVIPPSASTAQVQDMKFAFHAGILEMLQFQLEMTGTEDEECERLEVIYPRN